LDFNVFGTFDFDAPLMPAEPLAFLYAMEISLLFIALSRFPH